MIDLSQPPSLTAAVPSPSTKKSDLPQYERSDVYVGMAGGVVGVVVIVGGVVLILLWIMWRKTIRGHRPAGRYYLIYYYWELM